MSVYIALSFFLVSEVLKFHFRRHKWISSASSLRREVHSSGVYKIILRFLRFFPMRSPCTTEAFICRSEITNVNYLRPFWAITDHYCALKVRSLLLAPALVEVSACGVSYVTRAYILAYIHTHTHKYIQTRIYTHLHTYIRSYTHMYIHAHIYTHTHIQHTYVHKHTHTHTHTHTNNDPVPMFVTATGGGKSNCRIKGNTCSQTFDARWRCRYIGVALWTYREARNRLSHATVFYTRKG